MMECDTLRDHTFLNSIYASEKQREDIDCLDQKLEVGRAELAVERLEELFGDSGILSSTKLFTH